MMQSPITQARKHYSNIRKGIPTAQEVRARQEAEALVHEVKIIAAYLDAMLLETPCHHVSACEIWGVEVRLIRLSGVSYRLITETRVWRSITDLANAAAEYALAQGFISPAPIQ